MKFTKFINSISKIENIELPTRDSQFKMAPPYREELIKNQKNKFYNAKQAAVLALFYPDRNYITHLVLILRKTYKGVHSAQVGLPGGKREPEDLSLKQTALRETEEEIGVNVRDIKILKALSNIYIPPSNYIVQPFLGISEITPKFIKQDEEVEGIIEIALKDLINDDVVIKKNVLTSYNTKIEVPAFNLNGHVVWGATAMMLSEIKDLLKPLL